MKSIIVALSCIFFSVGIVFGEEKGLTANEIIEEVEDLLWGETQHGIYEMKIVTKEWTRALKMETWTKGTDRAFIRVLEPEKEKGVSYLKIGDQMWNYLPKIDRVIKIPSSMMMSSWMGSDFTNDDLVHESSISDDYDAELKKTYKDDTHGEAYLIHLSPKPDAAVVWAGIDEHVRKSDLMPLKAEFYDETDVLVRLLEYSEFKVMGGRKIPAVMTMLPQLEEEKGDKTIVRIKEIEFNVSIDKDVFTHRNLKRGIN